MRADAISRQIEPCDRWRPKSASRACLGVAFTGRPGLANMASSDDEVEITGGCSRSEKDAAGRANAIELDGVS